MQSRYPRLLTFTLRFIAIVQLFLGVSFLLVPEITVHMLKLSPAPDWAGWLFGLMAARFLGFAYGMWIASNDPAGARPWIVAMIGVQAIDWIVTIKYLVLGSVTLAQVTTASFLPVLFVIALTAALPRKAKS